MSTSQSLSTATRVTYFAFPGDSAPASASPAELHQPTERQPGAQRRLGRIVLMIVIALAVPGGIAWQIHRAAEAGRARAAMEMRAFEQRAQALRSEMSSLQDRIGQTRLQLGVLDHRAAPAARPPASQPTGDRPAAQARPAAAARPQPSRPSRPARPAPAPIVLSPGCANTPLGC